MKHFETFVCAVLCLFVTLPPPFASATSDSSSEDGISIIQRPETFRISEEGRIYVGDRETRLNQLARRLRREGISPKDTIYVSIPYDIPQRVLVSVSRELASHGYRRVIFTRPPRAVAETEGTEKQ